MDLLRLRPMSLKELPRRQLQHWKLYPLQFESKCMPELTCATPFALEGTTYPISTRCGNEYSLGMNFNEEQVISEISSIFSHSNKSNPEVIVGIGDDAAAKTGELVDRPDDAIPLKLVEFFPHDRGANAGGGVDDPVFVEPLAIAAEETIEDERVDQRRGPGFGELPHLADKLGSLRVSSRNGRPLGIKPGGEGRRFLGRLGALEERQGVGGRKTKPGRREGDGTNHGPGRGASGVAGYKHSLGDRARGPADINGLRDEPIGAARRQPA